MANSYILLFGGFETTSSTLSFCAYELALNENIQQNLRLEVQNVKDECGTLNYDSLKKMKFLEAVIAGRYLNCHTRFLLVISFLSH